MNEHTIHSLEQGRAAFAYNQVREIAALDPDQDGLERREADRRRSRQKKYKTSAKKLPVLIKTNGLGQALAYIQTRNVDLYDHLTAWLLAKELITDESGLVSQVINLGSDKYRQLTTESLAYLNWVRRFVDSLMSDVEGEEDL